MADPGPVTGGQEPAAGTGTYLYAIAREPDLTRAAAPQERAGAGRLAGVPGVAGTPVRALGRGGLVAYVSTVPLDRFGEEPLRRSLEDLEWLGETARAHHRVVAAVAARAAAAPVRLVTVYRDDEQVTALLERRHDELAALLDDVAGRQEWGVKMYAAAPDAGTPAAPGGGAGRHDDTTAEGAAGSGRAAAHPSARGTAAVPGRRPGTPAPETGRAATAPQAEHASGAAADAAGGRPGTEYLRRRQAGLRVRERSRQAAAERAERAHRALSAVAVASRRHRPQDPRLSGRQEIMLLNGAYLVDTDRGAEFAAAVAALREPDVEFELTGPWAPYSFTETAAGPPDAR
ncbi:gas vesicle protein [Sphaerisporangium rufum]|uniref:Gas vesicle protein n=1 Tax=Sphaerisporangium rufum TaxID=1381558 RepID=A0A919R8F0_9ACTN|nr:GvpL/GvpF family gas vesicle protein [Sphaerisporangium rufum]GII79162.1 gas vesicle protein [Sphaerisporangium rufum]